MFNFLEADMFTDHCFFPAYYRNSVLSHPEMSPCKSLLALAINPS